MMNRRKLSEAELFELAQKEAEYPLIAAGCTPSRTKGQPEAQVPAESSINSVARARKQEAASSV